MVVFRLVSELESVETIAEARSIRDLPRLNRTYGRAHWRKRKGVGTIELENGAMRRAELHWYEAHGIGRRELKFKRYVE
ncbi:MAG TPA: hypothetical protein VNJ70_07095 [Thermoanaerobaculia bacterium]|nr:hypothetical protein [Thermoanaerobaculia bacterium]